MASFSKMSVFPVGYFRSISSWLLRNRRDVATRIKVINAEILRIGFVRVKYRQVPDGSGSFKLTEERVGLSVTPGSTLERLLQAYIAQGGNPLGISPFAYPDSTALVEFKKDGTPVYAEGYPNGGVVAPKSVKYNSPVEESTNGFGPYQGGYLDTDRYYPNRIGGQPVLRDLSTAQVIHQIRGWANQDIKERVQDIEWRIIKQVDLREQLCQERDHVLVQAFGGALHGLPAFDRDRFNVDLTVQNLIQDMYALLFETTDAGFVNSYSPNENVAFIPFTFEDSTSEMLTG